MHLFNSSLAWPLGDAWVALACRLGDPRVTQSPTPRRQRVTTPISTKRNGISVASYIKFLQRPNQRTYAILFQSLDCSHARTSSPAEVMSFATLCLTVVHIFSTWLGQLTSSLQRICRHFSRGSHRNGLCKLYQFRVPTISTAFTYLGVLGQASGAILHAATVSLWCRE